MAAGGQGEIVGAPFRARSVIKRTPIARRGCSPTRVARGSLRLCGGLSPGCARVSDPARGGPKVSRYCLEEGRPAVGRNGAVWRPAPNKCARVAGSRLPDSGCARVSDPARGWTEGLPMSSGRGKTCGRPKRRGLETGAEQVRESLGCAEVSRVARGSMRPVRLGTNLRD